MRELNRIGLAVFNLYLIFSSNIIQIVTADRPTVAGSVGEDSSDSQKQNHTFSKTQSRESRQLDDFSPSLQFDQQFGQRIDVQKSIESVASAGSDSLLQPSSHELQQQASLGSYDFQQPAASQEPDTAEYTFRRASYLKPLRGRRRQYSGSNGLRNRFRTGVARQDENRLQKYQNYISGLEINRPPPRIKHRQRLNSILTPNYVRFNGERPQLLKGVGSGGYDLKESGETVKKAGGFLDLFLSGLTKSSNKVKKENNLSEPSYEFIYDSLDDDYVLEKDFETETFLTHDDYDEFNIDYVGHDIEPTKLYDFKDVLYSIRDNETRIETFKKFLSAASGMTTRASTDPSFMIFNMPVTVLSILGGFYALSAIAVLSYKYALYTAGSSNGAAVAIIPVAVSFLVPVLIVTAYLVIRSTLDGQVSFSHLARGDLNHAIRPDFDPVTFVYDAAVGSTALLGIGWIVSVVL